MTIEKSVLVPLDAEQTFALLTEPERLRRWHTIAGRVDLRVGGEFRFTVVPDANAGGTFLEVEPGKRLIYTWGWEGVADLPPGASTVTVTLEPADGGTSVRIVHEGLTPQQEVDHSAGWDHFLARLATAGRDGEAGLNPWLGREADAWDQLAAAEASLAICEYVLSKIGRDEGTKQTPCAKYDVDQLAEHLSGSLVTLGGSAGVSVSPKRDAPVEVRIADMGQPVLEGWRRRGLEGDVTLTSSPIPATMACGILTLELLVHAWDFAQATGQTLPPSDGLATYVLGLAEGLIQPNFRDGDNFADEVPVGTSADPMERLMAYTGRQP
jgi:uncharacterized protein (TIGR03086 family)